MKWNPGLHVRKFFPGLRCASSGLPSIPLNALHIIQAIFPLDDHFQQWYMKSRKRNKESRDGGRYD